MKQLHSWDVDIAEARRIQEELRSRVIVRPIDRPVRLVAGADASYDDAVKTARGAIVVLDLHDFQLVESVSVSRPNRFPYIPGLLAFREAPVLLAAWQRLSVIPDAVIVDGQGLAHPSRFGLACHLGIWLGVPAIGCAKTSMLPFEQPGPLRGNSSPLLLDGEQVGVALRTRDRVKPVLVSPGHLADVQTAMDVVMQCSRGFRLPEPLRYANTLANE